MSKGVVKTPAMTTLDGVFNQVPKINHRRNFLRENKLSLKDLQRVSSNSKQNIEHTQHTKSTKQQTPQQKQQQQQTPQQKQQQQQQQRSQKPQQYSLGQRRSSSLTRLTKQQSETKQELQVKPSNSQHRGFSKASSQQFNGLNDIDYRQVGGGDGFGRTTLYDMQHKPPQYKTSQHKSPQNSSASLTSKLSKVCDKQIQTEDIKDEMFLYDALKKCTSNEVNVKQSQKELQHENEDNKRDDAADERYSNDVDETHLSAQQNVNVDGRQQYNDHRQQGGRSSPTPSIAQSIAPSIAASITRNHHYAQRNGDDDAASLGSRISGYKTHAVQHQEHDSRNEVLENDHNNEQDSDDDQQLSARSVITVRSVNSHASLLSKKASADSLHKSITGSHNKESTESIHKSSGGSVYKKSNGSLYKEPTTTTPSIHKSSNGSIHRFEAQKQSNGSIQKCATGRDDIRLPRYLEREKREKEEESVRAGKLDPNCPYGHFILPEKERLEALGAARNRFQELVGELNRMPMTSETLRMRARKVEIERELAVIESDIRTFTKPKVYVRIE